MKLEVYRQKLLNLTPRFRYLFSPFSDCLRKGGARKPRRICTKVQLPHRPVCSRNPHTKKECYYFPSHGGVRMCLLMLWLLVAAQASLGWYMNGMDHGSNGIGREKYVPVVLFPQQILVWTAPGSNSDLRSDKPVTYTVHRGALFIVHDPYHLKNCQKSGIVSMHIICSLLQQNIEALHTSVGTLIVATIYLQLIQNRYMFRSFNVLQCSHQHCVQPVASDVEVVGYL